LNNFGSNEKQLLMDRDEPWSVLTERCTASLWPSTPSSANSNSNQESSQKGINYEKFVKTIMTKILRLFP